MIQKKRRNKLARYECLHKLKQGYTFFKLPAMAEERIPVSLPRLPPPLTPVDPDSLSLDTSRLSYRPLVLPTKEAC